MSAVYGLFHGITLHAQSVNGVFARPIVSPRDGSGATIVTIVAYSLDRDEHSRYADQLAPMYPLQYSHYDSIVPIVSKCETFLRYCHIN